MRILMLPFLLPIFTLCHGQVLLKSFFGLDSLPKNESAICTIPNYLGSFSQSGYQTGDTVHDFQLFDLNGNAFHLAKALGQNKPVLLISASYTCPVFRGKAKTINELYERYKDQIAIYIVYTVEAHPDKDISPYFGKVNTNANNFNEGILFRQPMSYGQRIEIVKDMLAKMDILPPVLIDGPCNDWWLHYGPAPNNATLIRPDGTVYTKHAWFDRDPDDIFCDLKHYFNPNSICDSTETGSGNFRFTMVSDSIVKGMVEATLYARGHLENMSASPVVIDIRRLLNDLPPGWESSMCIDLCYPTSVDSTQITLAPGQKMDLIIDVFTGTSPGKANIRLGMRNKRDEQNKAFMRISVETTEVTVTKSATRSSDVSLYPSPAHSYTLLKTKEYQQYQLLDQKGQILRSSWIDESAIIEQKELPDGLYFIRLLNNEGKEAFKRIIFY